MTDRSGPITVGVDVGGTKILALALDQQGATLGEYRGPTPAGPDALLDAIVVATRTATSAEDGRSAVAVGVGVPGLIDDKGVLRFAPNLPGVVEFAVRDGLQDRLGLPVAVDNDANVAAWGENVAGAGQGADDLLMVTLGTGIGGGIVLGGQLYRGAHGMAGEVGHIVVEADGLICPCGRRGCWERYASGSALGRLGREAVARGDGPSLAALMSGDATGVRGEDVIAAAAAGHADALTVVDEFARWVAVGLAGLVNVLDPSLIVIGGGLVSAGDLLLDPVRNAFASRVEGAGHRPPTPIRAATLGGRAGAIGAALAARALVGK